MANNELYKWAGVDDPWQLVDAALRSGATRIFLDGLPGIGKSHAGIFSQNNGKPVFQVSLSEDLSVQELMGHFVPKGSVFEWHDGPVVMAWRQGTTLIVNEIQRASESVKDALLGVLDDPAIARISLPSGETIKPSMGFRVVATSNEPVSALDPALQDRFDVILHLDRPNPKLIQYLNQQIPGIGDAIADSYKDPDRFISPRRAMAFIQLLKDGITERQAALMAFGERGRDILVAIRSRSTVTSYLDRGVVSV